MHKKSLKCKDAIKFVGKFFQLFKILRVKQTANPKSKPI